MKSKVVGRVSIAVCRPAALIVVPCRVCSEIDRRTIIADTLLKLMNLCKGRVLTARAEQVSERRQLYTPIATLVEQRKGLFVVGRCLLCMLVSAYSSNLIHHHDQCTPSIADSGWGGVFVYASLRNASHEGTAPVRYVPFLPWF